MIAKYSALYDLLIRADYEKRLRAEYEERLREPKLRFPPKRAWFAKQSDTIEFNY
jgi:hypothetical protein